MAQRHGEKTGPPLPGELLAELLALVGDIHGVLDPDALLAARLGMGDLVVFFTDGLVEARRDLEEYGQERLLRGLEAHAGLAAPQVGERLISELEDGLPVSRITPDVRYTGLLDRANWLCSRISALSWRWSPSRPPPPGRCSPSRRGATWWCSLPRRWTARAGP